MPARHLQLTLHAGASAPVRYRFEGEAVTVGRAADCDLVVPDPELSRAHARLSRDGEGNWTLADLGSRNGTRLNGRRLAAPVPIADGDEIGLGAAVLVVSLPLGARRSAERELATVEKKERAQGQVEPALVGSSPAIARLRADIARMAATDKTVLITGESGTGKELVAQLLHQRSPRAAGPFVVINCPALAPALQEAELFGVDKGVATGVEARIGRFEAARGGTVFLDEIGDMELAAQAKILRALQARAIERVGGRASIALDVRVVAATHHDLDADVAAGRFRGNLLHRLHVLTIHVPPLRERSEDIVLLAEHFLAAEGTRQSLSEEAKAALVRRDFPGNVRELEHLIASASVAAEERPSRRPTWEEDEVLQPRPLAGQARILLARIVKGGESFWDVVQKPYLRRELSRDQARDLVRRAYEQGGRSYRGVARLFGIEAEYQKLFDFLKNHDLRVGE